MNPSKPLKASHRFIRKLLEILYDGKVTHFPEEYELVSKIFKKAGGSWERVFQGSIEDVQLLKKTIKVAYKMGYITKAPNWSGKKEKEKKPQKKKPDDN